MDPIAVIGIGCRLPAAPDIDSLWQLLLSGRDALRAVPRGRYLDLDEATRAPDDPRRRLIKLPGGFLDGIDLFDASAFDISPREARVIDPQQRLLLETTWEALDDAGQDMHRLRGAPVGVYVGVWGSDYQARLFRASPRIDISMTTGGGRYAAAGRLSYSFDFRGPSLTIDTACSSSLVAVHMACQALRAGECSLAIAGGANLILDSAVTLGYLAAGALSPNGRCKFGDASADGYVRSEGVGIVALKRLDRALIDKDPIHAIIRGSAVTHNGQTGGSLLAPGEAGQIELLRQALAAAQIDAADLDYIEAHGTGTRVGDRMELRALGHLLSERRTPGIDRCLIGSIKTNIGHTESAAGIAGLIKAILCLKHRQIPASLHFRQPNPEVPWNDLPLQIVTELMRLRDRQRPAIAGVNSFGITGTFAHVVLEEAAFGSRFGGARTISPTNAKPADLGANGRLRTLLPISARSRAALDILAGAFAEQIRRAPDTLSNVAFGAALRRTHHELRLAAVGNGPQQLSDLLEAFARGEAASGLSVPPESGASAPCLGWVFSGQGPQWPGMGRQLFDHEPIYRATLERLESLIKSHAGWSLIGELNAPAAVSKLGVTAIAQPAIFAVQVALAALLDSWGVKPAMVVGHSVGEAAAAYVAGLYSLEDAVHVICERARIAEQAAGLGKMAAVELSVDEAQEMIADLGEPLSLAAVNGPRSLTISGAAESLHRFCERVAARGRFCRVLDVNYPFHSELLDPLLPEMSTVGQGIAVSAPHTPLYSTVHGRLSTTVDFSSCYWRRNLRETVQFAPAIKHMAAAGCNLFVEFGPHPVLSYSIKQLLQAIGASGAVVETLRRDGDAGTDLRKTVGELYVRGYDPNWSTLVPPDAEAVPLPAYPWQRDSYWIDEHTLPAIGSARATESLPADPLLQRSFRSLSDGRACYWESNVSLEHYPWLKDHVVQGRVVYPAAAYLLPALKSARHLLPGALLADVDLHEALFVPPAATISVQYRFLPADDGTYSLTVFASGLSQPDLARKHVTAHVSPNSKSAAFPKSLADPSKAADSAAIERSRVYAAMRRGRLDYGPAFQAIESLQIEQDSALARLILPAEIQDEVSEYGVHPATLDACIQTLVALTPDWLQGDVLWMPRAIGEFWLGDAPAPHAALWARAQLTAPANASSSEVVGDVFLVDQAGAVLLAARGLRLQRVERRVDTSPWIHEIRWQPRPLPSALVGSGDACLPSPTELKGRMARVHSSSAERQVIRAARADLNRIAGISVQRAFGQLGFAFKLGCRFNLDELIAEMGVVPQHRQLLGRLLQILVEDGVLSFDGVQWLVERQPDSHDLTAQLSAAASANADFAPLWRVFGCASFSLAAALSGQADTVELLFGGDGAADLEQLYTEAVFWREPLRRLEQAVAAVVEQLPAGRKLHVLEIGAGTGGLTSHLLPLLPADRTEYVFTDLSSYFLRRASEKFAAYPFLTGKILDIEQDPLRQGFTAGSFDLVLAANCLHATRSVRQSLEHVQQLMAPGALLMLQEETGRERWTDLIFGLTDGWWRFDEADLRPDHPLLSHAAWVRVLGEQGFADAATLGGDGENDYPASVILARQPETDGATATASDRGSWCLLSGKGGFAQQLASCLEALGQSCRVFWAANQEPATAAQCVSNWLAEVKHLEATVVDLRALDAQLVETDDAATLEATQRNLVTGFSELVRCLDDCGGVRAPRLVLVTRGSQATGAENAGLELAQASVWNIARVAASEHPRLPITRIDLDPAPLDRQIDALAAELLRVDGEPEIALRQATRLVPRLHRLDAPGDDRLPLPEDGPFTAEIVNRGVIDGIAANSVPRRKPAADEVQIRVLAAGINLRDVLNVLGAVDRVPLGLECSGIVTGVGSGVQDIAVGDEVTAIGFGSWSTYFNTKAALVAAKPPQLGHERAAGLPIAYLTAHYALRHVTQLVPGMRVLIHSAAGGVGLAAVHLALAAGAEVFGTAGSPAKRDYLRSLGVSHVFDSRSLKFADEILAVCGRQIDVVLNCFSGEFISKSLDLLSDHGCFVEIGKRDIWTNAEMSARRPDVHYHVIELAEVMRSAPQTLQPMLRQLAGEVAVGSLPALPIRAFPISHLVPALRFMQQGLHTGKIVLSVPAGSLANTAGDKSKFAKSQFAGGSWLLTGAFGGLGLAVAEWLVERGARHLMMVGRNAPQESALAPIERIRARGAQALVAVCDVANERELAAVLERGSRELSPLRGVFHMAGALDDAPLAQLSWPRFANVYRPKMLGGWNLHRLTRGLQLDYFVLFSSWTALAGSPGQANHASASAFLDALAHHRRQQGLPAQTVNWGGWCEVGSAARPERLAHLDRQGVGSLSPTDALAALEQVMSTDAIQVGISPFNAAAWRATNPNVWPARFTEFLVTNESLPATDTGIASTLTLRESLEQALPGPTRRQLLEGCIQRQLSRVLRMPAAKFDLRKSFKSFGLDSLTSLELRNHLEADAGVRLPASLVYNHATIANLAIELAAQMGIAIEADTAAAAERLVAPSATADDELADLLGALEQLPAEEALRLLGSDALPGGGR